jgi:hypothetical protein
MKFFKLEDFDLDEIANSQDIIDIVNAKLEREGKVVYSNNAHGWNENGPCISLKKALLINIEPIEKCTHPVEKVGLVSSSDTVNGNPARIDEFFCGCGVKVKPKSYEVV